VKTLEVLVPATWLLGILKQQKVNPLQVGAVEVSGIWQFDEPAHLTMDIYFKGEVAEEPETQVVK